MLLKRFIPGTRLSAYFRAKTLIPMRTRATSHGEGHWTGGRLLAQVATPLPVVSDVRIERRDDDCQALAP
jgi:hypothetical protein